MPATTSVLRGMQVSLVHAGRTYTADLGRPISIALPLKPGPESTRAWSAPALTLEPVRVGAWVGSVREGAPVNFMDLRINLHGNATHTETFAHVAPDWEAHTILDVLPVAPFVARLYDLSFAEAAPARGRVVDCTGLRQNPPNTPGVILRILGKDAADENRTGTDPPYFQASDLGWLAERGVVHLITDLFSVDRERDGGELAGHHAYWQYPNTPRTRATITELARLNQPLAQGLYLVGLHALPLAADASPSAPLIYPLNPVD